jgi:type I restriction enzyme S subunit
MREPTATHRRLGDIADINPETLSANTPTSARFRYIDLSAVEGGFVNWCALEQTTFATAPSRARRVVRPLDILFGTVRPGLQSHGRIPPDERDPLVASTGFSVIRARAGVSHPGYLFHSIMSSPVTSQAVRNAIGSSYPAVNDGDVRGFQVFLPSYGEQDLIAQILDTLDTAIYETEAIIAKLKAVKQGLLHDLLTRGIAANGELRPPQSEAPHLYKQSPLGWIPKEWDYAPLVSRIDFPEGQVDPRQAPFRDWILVAPDHIEPGTGRLLSWATAAEQQAISGKYVFEVGDVIYSKIRPYLRKAVLAVATGLCSADMYPLRPKAGVNPRYLLAVLLGDQFSRFSESVSMRSGFPKINRSEMSEFAMGWPLADEQARIARVLMGADAKQESAEAEHHKLQLLKSGLMDDLLTGRVRVTPLLQEPQPA